MKADKTKLNLNYLDYTNLTHSDGEYDLPSLSNRKISDIDYIALYTDISEYHKTNKTCICFYQYDNLFDGIHGLFNAVYYKEEKLLSKYKERFKGVKYAISPDYSQFGDIQKAENYYRYFKARVVSLWLKEKLNIEVIPNITYGNEQYFPNMIEGYTDCEVIAFSVMGSYRDKRQKELLVKAVKYAVDNLFKLKQILVYSVNLNDEDALKLFSYAQEKGIKVMIPDNKLKSRNRLLKESSI